MRLAYCSENDFNVSAGRTQVNLRMDMTNYDAKPFPRGPNADWLVLVLMITDTVETD